MTYGIEPGRPLGRGLVAAAVTAALLLGSSSPAPAQALPPGANSGGLGDHDLATVSGPGAVALNPARLGLRPAGAATAAVALRFGAALDPVTLSDVADHQGRPVPARVRDVWLERIEEGGGERGTATARLVPFALTSGRWGVQLSTTGHGRVELNADAAELILFGNVGRRGESRRFDLEGSRIDGRVVSTLAVASAGRPVEIAGGRFALGATVKLVVGHAILVARDAGSTVDGEPLDLRFRFPLISGPSAGRRHAGAGLGLDVGAAWEGDGTMLGLVVRDALNTFEWDLEALTFRPGTALFDQEGSDADFEERPAAEAPAELRDAVEDADFGPALEIGAGRRVSDEVLLVGSAWLGTARGEDPSPAWRIGIGAELARWERVPLRAHVGVLEEALQLGGGGTVRLGPVRLTGAGWLRTGSAEDAAVGAVEISWTGG